MARYHTAFLALAQARIYLVLIWMIKYISKYYYFNKSLNFRVEDVSTLTSAAVHSLKAPLRRGCGSWKLRTIKSEAPSFASPYTWCLLISAQHRQIYLLATTISHAVNIPTLTGFIRQTSPGSFFWHHLRADIDLPHGSSLGLPAPLPPCLTRPRGRSSGNGRSLGAFSDGVEGAAMMWTGLARRRFPSLCPEAPVAPVRWSTWPQTSLPVTSASSPISTWRLCPRGCSGVYGASWKQGALLLGAGSDLSSLT